MYVTSGYERDSDCVSVHENDMCSALVCASVIMTCEYVWCECVVCMSLCMSGTCA